MRGRGWQLAAVAAAVGLVGCAFDDRVVFVPQGGGGGGVADVTPDAGGEPDAASGPVQAVVVNQVGFDTDPNRTPRSVHSTFEGDPGTSITFTWTTRDIDLQAYVPRVWIVPASEVSGEGAAAVMPWAEAWTAVGIGNTYREALLGQEVGEEDFVVWHVRVEGLQPATEYVYRVGTWASFDAAAGRFEGADLSEPARIRSGRSAGDMRPFKVVLAGDSRGGQEQIRASVERFRAIDSELWFFNGDLTQNGSQPEYDAWFDAMQPLLRDKVLMPVQGNHEIFANLYYEQFALPQMPGLPEHMNEHAWSIDYGSVHFVGLESNTSAAVEDQTAWLDADLAAAAADDDIRWTIVMMHHPPYSASNHGSTTRLQEHWVPLFEKHGVDLVFAGHDHNYERTHFIRNDQIVEEGEGVVYVVAGAFFSPGYSNGQDWWTVTSAHGDLGNYVQLSVSEGALSMKAFTIDGESVLDELTLTR